MATNVVNLDALIPREDFNVDAKPLDIEHDPKIPLSKLTDGFFGGSLRKPDFQRETYHWSPSRVVDLIRSFLDGELIPAVILWQSGSYVFVIDGAHRLSALLAWLHDDYGDRARSQKYFDYRVPDEQIRLAKRTRDLVQKTIGPYAEYVAAQGKPADDIRPDMRPRIARINASHSLTAQWVLSRDPKVAEDSFFKINQEASPIDPTERRIIKGRESASAVSARAITRAGGGHRYWQKFATHIRDEIESRSKALYEALYHPPMDEGYLKSADVPVAGKGYNSLPFVFDLVNLANDQKITDSTAKRPIKEDLPKDPTGELTVGYLKRVESLVERVTGNESKSYGVHPLVYFYSRTGTFQPVAFFAVARMLKRLEEKGLAEQFLEVRERFENYLIRHREGISIIIHKLGSGTRSLARMEAYFERVLAALLAGASDEDIQKGLAGEQEWKFLIQDRGPSETHDQPTAGGSFNKNTKSATVISQGLAAAVRCGICGGYIHRNSMHIDHKHRKSEGGLNSVENAHVAHPICDALKG
ncbi:DUF262 domain-containing protein [Mesorhizobium sp.]|uniref:GmrSD restriction endonuclease domain-containing protein n=1 Tax=Mesorhizobium sp. TaxID=1871066 RepID=UPI0011F456C6|nr:DUF262 domain-containing protein [Mesorhizobium sp.]TIP38318.1 MAG: DUF262 domain-containing protein [Mesorhizobium sp.]